MSDFIWQTSFTFADDVSADATEALFGRAPTDYQVTLDIPARRRTFWEWLTRKPRHRAYRLLLPNVRLNEQGPVT